jgi:glycosyltransferase involved in cell wall biosynthesis
VQCAHFGRVHTRHGQIAIHQCAEFGHCTEVDHGLIGRGKLPIAVCRGCPKFKESWNHGGIVDVVITSHNYGKFLDDALNSLRDQDDLGQVIVVDDASDPGDQTKEICERRGVQYLRTEFRSPHLARGAGFALCNARLVQFLDADNTLPGGYLSEAARLFAANPRLAIVHASRQHFGQDSRLIQVPPIVGRDGLERENGIVGIDTSSVWLREAIQQVSGFDHDPSGWEDWYLAREIMRAGKWEIAKNPIPVNYRIHAEQRTQSGIAKRPYYDRAGIADECVTVFCTFSDRVQKDLSLWTRRKEWLRNQTWLRIRIVVANTSHQPLPSGWSDDVPACDGVSWYDHPVGSQVGLENVFRGEAGVEKSVQTAVAAIYNRMFREVATEYILTLEDDVFPDRLDAIEQLAKCVEQDTAAVTGAYQQRYYPNGWTVFFSIPANGRPKLQANKGTGVQNIMGTGFGCLLIRKSQVEHEVLVGNGERSIYYDAAWFERLSKQGRKCRINWGVECEHVGMIGTPPVPAATFGTFAPCDNLGPEIRVDQCEVCGLKGKTVQVRQCDTFGECASTRYRDQRKNQPQVCNRACAGFTSQVSSLPVLQ